MYMTTVPSLSSLCKPTTRYSSRVRACLACL